MEEGRISINGIVFSAGLARVELTDGHYAIYPPQDKPGFTCKLYYWMPEGYGGEYYPGEIERSKLEGVEQMNAVWIYVRNEDNPPMVIEDDPIEDELGEDEYIEDEPLEDELGEDEYTEDEPLEDELGEDEHIEDEPLEDEVAGEDPMEGSPTEDSTEPVEENKSIEASDEATGTGTPEEDGTPEGTGASENTGTPNVSNGTTDTGDQTESEDTAKPITTDFDKYMSSKYGQCDPRAYVKVDNRTRDEAYVPPLKSDLREASYREDSRVHSTEAEHGSTPRTGDDISMKLYLAAVIAFISLISAAAIIKQRDNEFEHL